MGFIPDMVASISLSALFVAYASLVVVLSLLLTLLLQWAGSTIDYLEVVATFTGTSLPDATGPTTQLRIAELAARTVVMGSTTIFLGAVFSKFFLRRRFRWRQRACLTRHNRKPVLELRFENAGHLPVHDVEVKAYLRQISTARGARVAANERIKLTGANDVCESAGWPTLSGGMPATVRVPIDAAAWECLYEAAVHEGLTPGGTKLANPKPRGSIGCCELGSRGEAGHPHTVQIEVIVSGTTGATGAGVSEAHLYRLCSGPDERAPEIEFGRPAAIDYWERTRWPWSWYPIRTWGYRGARRFDDLDHLVFVYGSLMESRSMMKTLEPRGAKTTGSVRSHRRRRARAQPDMEPVRLQGWRRSWDCVSVWTFLDDKGVRVRRVVLGLDPDEGAECEGVLLQVSGRQFARLRKREAAYQPVSVTTLVPEAPGPVTVFVPRAEKRRRAYTDLEPLIIEESYLKECRRGAEAHGLTEALADLADLTDPVRVPYGARRKLPPSTAGESWIDAMVLAWRRRRLPERTGYTRATTTQPVGSGRDRATAASSGPGTVPGEPRGSEASGPGHHVNDDRDDVPET